MLKKIFEILYTRYQQNPLLLDTVENIKLKINRIIYRAKKDVIVLLLTELLMVTPLNLTIEPLSTGFVQRRTQVYYYGEL